MNGSDWDQMQNLLPDPSPPRAAFVNPLKPEGPKEEEDFNNGECKYTSECKNTSVFIRGISVNRSPVLLCLTSVNKTRRMELSKASLLKVAPTAEERTLVHSLFLNTLDTKYD